MLLKQKIKIKVIPYLIKNLNQKGYKCKYGDEIFIDVKDLCNGSNKIVKVQCDYCNKIFEKEYYKLINQRKNINKDCCKECCHIKNKEATIKKYNVSNIFELEEYQIKAKNMMFEKYGYHHPQQVPEIKEKTKKTCINKYGFEYVGSVPSLIEKRKNNNMKKYGVKNTAMLKEVQDKIKKTCIVKYNSTSYFGSEAYKECIKKKYNVTHISQSKEIIKKTKMTNINKYGVSSVMKLQYFKDKQKQTCLKKYGVEYVLQHEDIREKQIMYLKEKNKVSKLQIELFNIILEIFPEAQLEFPFKRYLLDIYLNFNNINLDIEYDCFYWHCKELDDLRDEYLTKNGFKVLRIKSGSLMPKKEIILQEIELLLNTDKIYGEIILDDYIKGRC
jgi:hypothetical protein